MPVALGPGGVTDAPFAIEGDILFTQGNGCWAAPTGLVGELVVDGGRLAIQDDRGLVTPVIWRAANTARRGLLGGEVEVIYGWSVVATTGHRYKFGGQFAPQFGGGVKFWACGNVIPA